MPRLHLAVLTTRNETWRLQYEASFLSTLQTKYCASLTTRKYFLEAFFSVPGCQTCMYKRGISLKGVNLSSEVVCGSPIHLLCCCGSLWFRICLPMSWTKLPHLRWS